MSEMSPFDQGHKAFEKGYSRDHCQYDHGTEEFDRWMRGYLIADRDDDELHGFEGTDNFDAYLDREKDWMDRTYPPPTPPTSLTEEPHVVYAWVRLVEEEGRDFVLNTTQIVTARAIEGDVVRVTMTDGHTYDIAEGFRLGNMDVYDLK